MTMNIRCLILGTSILLEQTEAYNESYMMGG